MKMNFKIPTDIKIFFAYVVLMLMLLSLRSCKVQEKAEKRVLADIESVKRVRAKTDALFPCVNDTVFTIKSDTITTVDFFYDTVYSKVNDTVVLTKNVSKVTVQKIRDTVNIVVVDGRALKAANDSLSAVREREANLNGQITQLKSDLNKSKSLNTWLIVGIAVVVGGVLVLLVLRLKNSILPKFTV